MARPFHRLNSEMAEDLPSLPMSLFLAHAGNAADEQLPTRQTTTPNKTIGPPALVPE